MTDRAKPGVLPLEQARSIVEQHATFLRPKRVESVTLLEAAGRVLAEDIVADRDFPPFPRATRDGYALRSADVAQTPVTLRVVAEIRAGQSPGGRGVELQPGEAVEIMTGAPVPAGADAVVMIEYTQRDAGRVVIQRSAAPGENFVPAAAEARQGEVLLQRGHRVGHAAVAVAASVGRSEVGVYARPHVAVLATGDEIVEIGAQPGPHQIRNSNTYSLGAQVRAAGAEPILLPVAPDQAGRLRGLLREGLSADLLLITGGVSMGKYDLVEQVLAELQAEFFFTGAQIQPGKPVVFGRCPMDFNAKEAEPAGPEPDTKKLESGATTAFKYFLGLPGNPVSTMVTFELFGRPLINALSGAPAGKLRFVQARLKSEIRTRTGLTRFLPAILTGEYHRAEVELVPWKGSGDIAAQARANCYIVVPRDRDHIFADGMVDVLLA